MNDISTKQRILAVAAHAGFLLGGIGFLVLPFIIKVIWSDDEFVAAHARQAFRIQIGALLVSILIIPLALVISPVIATIAGIALLAIGGGFFAIFAAIRALAGEMYVYPLLKMLHFE